ncbi:MAG: M50 family metallopeptidase [Pirellulaceae bacterium]|nr:M50 family metallopeptidase [Pirellulaceae bacterium]
MSQRVDRWIEWCKWPVAVLALAALPLAALAVLSLLRQLVLAPAAALPFLAGFGAYLALWWLWLRRPLFGSFFATLEHELTHALFAVLTLHRVTGLRATWSRGGSMSFMGRGNWLITIAPYFFPTICLLVLAVSWLVSWLLPAALRSFSDALMGAALAYHLSSTMRETHAGQTDLARVGWLFSLMFLPTANLLVFGGIVSYAYGGPAALADFLRSLADPLS